MGARFHRVATSGLANIEAVNPTTPWRAKRRTTGDARCRLSEGERLMKIRLLGICLVLVTVAACGGGGSPSPSAPSAPQAPAQPANIAGTYTLTIQASAVCTTLSSRVRTLTYTATVTQSGQSVGVNLVPAVGSMFSNVSGGLVTGNNVSFQWGFTHVGLSGRSFTDLDQLLVYGMTATIPATSLSGSWDGTYNYLLTNENCNAANHTFNFQRR